jgi:hypothetical protein
MTTTTIEQTATTATIDTTSVYRAFEPSQLSDILTTKEARFSEYDFSVDEDEDDYEPVNRLDKLQPYRWALLEAQQELLEAEGAKYDAMAELAERFIAHAVANVRLRRGSQEDRTQLVADTAQWLRGIIAAAPKPRSIQSTIYSA